MFENAYFSVQVIPPVGPRLLDASLLFEQGSLDDGTQNAERHRDTMIVIAAYAHVLIQLRYWPAIDLQTVVEFLGCNSELS